MRKNAANPELDGVPPKPAKKPRKAFKPQPRQDVLDMIENANKDKDSRGRLASEVQQRDVRWLLQPWIPCGMLTLVVGLPSVGKSTFMAWLIAQAGCACILPGYEEEVEVTTLARLKVNKAKLQLIRFLDDREYRLPRDKKRIVSIMRGWEAEVLVIDPIDSYMDDELNENTGKDVRSLLESAAWIAAQTGAAVVGVRHPGKSQTNALPGSRQWRAVPRSIVELMHDGNTPGRLLVRHYKDSLGQDARPREYFLEGERGKPRRFVLKEEIDPSIAGFAQAEGDPTERVEIRKAGRYARFLFESSQEPLVNDLVILCRTNGVGDRARRQACRLLGIDEKPNGSGGKWIMFRMAKEWPAWVHEPKEIVK